MLFMLNRISYMDETGHADDPVCNYVGMAGFVAPAGIWEVFSERWQTTLNNACLKKPFHMKEFAHFQGEFEGWKESDRKLLLGELIKHIREINASPVAAIVSLRDYETLTPSQQSYFGDPYYLAFQTATRGAALEASGYPSEETEPIAMVYSYNEEYGTTNGGCAEQMWHMVKKHWEKGNLMGSYASSTPQLLCPLQAADVFAYELAHDFERMIKCPTSSMRWGLRQFLYMYQIPLPQIRFFERRALLRLIRNSYPDKTGVEELGSEMDEMVREQAFMTRWMIERGKYDEEFEV
jgi:hypothetical protein